MVETDISVRYNEALKAKGIRTGITILTPQQKEEWKDYSDKELVAAGEKAFHLTEKNRIAKILWKIYEDTQRPVHIFQLRKEVEKYKPNKKEGDKGLSTNEYMYAFEHWDKLKADGNSSKHKYLWQPEEKPVFSDAETVFNFVQGLKTFSIHPKSKDYVKDNLHKSFEEIDAILNEKKDLFMSFKLKVLYHAQKALERKRNERKPPITFDRELSRDLPVDKEEEEKEKEIEVVGDELIDKKAYKKHDSLVSILEQRAEYYRKLVKLEKEHYKRKLKVKNEYIKSLEKQLSEKKVVISDTSGSM